MSIAEALEPSRWSKPLVVVHSPDVQLALAESQAAWPDAVGWCRCQRNGVEGVEVFGWYSAVPGADNEWHIFIAVEAQEDYRGGWYHESTQAPMRDPDRPKDIIDHVEELAAQHGSFEPVDEDYYRAFLDLTQPQVEKLAVAVMLDQEREVRRLAAGKTDPVAVARVSKLVRNVLKGISIGVARFDAFGRLGFVSRVGIEPEPGTGAALERRYEEIAPMIQNTVRRTLPWLLSREISQGQLPL